MTTGLSTLGADGSGEPRPDDNRLDVTRLLMPGPLQRGQPLHEQRVRDGVERVAALPHVPTHVREHQHSHAQNRQNHVGIHLGSHTFPSSRRMLSFTLYTVSALNPDRGGMNL